MTKFGHEQIGVNPWGLAEQSLVCLNFQIESVFSAVFYSALVTEEYGGTFRSSSPPRLYVNLPQPGLRVVDALTGNGYIQRSILCSLLVRNSVCARDPATADA